MLPEGFTVQADHTLIVADYGTARLVGFTPSPADKRAQVAPESVARWIAAQASALRRNAYHYTPEAKAAAFELLDALGLDR